MRYKKYPKKNFKHPAPAPFSGVLQATERGFAFVIPDDKQKYQNDFFVPPHALYGALDGDKVLARHVSGTTDEACIVKVVERGHSKVVGTLQFARRKAYVIPDNNRLPEIFVADQLLNGARDGDKVVCEVTSYPKGRLPGGKICEVLGESGYLDTEELCIIREANLREEFPADVLEEADYVSKAPVETGGRRDLRDKLIFTIDGADTRDIDDGVSIERDGGNYILGVHIADVSSYVKYNSALDKEAYARGTSVYFPDRVLPMLPKALSNGACSLNEGEDRYALSCLMTFTSDGKRLSYEIFKSVIRSRHKLTYPDVTKMLESGKPTAPEYADALPALENMKKLCLALEKRREDAGCVDLDVQEAHIYYNDGEITIPPAERTISERLIEQFMISANEAVAEFLEKKKAPCLYRIHEIPAAEKAENFFGFLRDLGVNVRVDCDNIAPKDFQNILNKTADKPFAAVISKVMLRTMQKARYSPVNLKHFGLASDCYCHFTSPIRRYPDLFVHRVLHCIFEGKSYEKYLTIAEKAATDCSARERVADDCERKVDDLYKLAYMSDRIGEEFDAVVSGVTKHGIYCELDNLIEGLVQIEDLPKDNYEFFPEKYLLKGHRRSFRLGDSLRVKVADCDLGKMKVLFMLV